MAVSADLVGNPEDRFSQNEAHIVCAHENLMSHYVNTPMQYTASFTAANCDVFLLIHVGIVWLGRYFQKPVVKR